MGNIALTQLIAVVGAIGTLLFGLMAARDNRIKAKAEAAKIDADNARTIAEANKIVIDNLMGDLQRMRDDLKLERQEVRRLRIELINAQQNAAVVTARVMVLEQAMSTQGLDVPPMPPYPVPHPPASTPPEIGQ